MTKEAKDDKQEWRPTPTSEAVQRGYCTKIITYWRAHGHPEVEAYLTSKVKSLEIWSNVAEWWQPWDGEKARTQHRTKARRLLGGDDEPAGTP